MAWVYKKLRLIGQSYLYPETSLKLLSLKDMIIKDKEIFSTESVYWNPSKTTSLISKCLLAFTNPKVGKTWANFSNFEELSFLRVDIVTKRYLRSFKTIKLSRWDLSIAKLLNNWYFGPNPSLHTQSCNKRPLCRESAHPKKNQFCSKKNSKKFKKTKQK